MHSPLGTKDPQALCTIRQYTLACTVTIVCVYVCMYMYVCVHVYRTVQKILEMVWYFQGVNNYYGILINAFMNPFKYNNNVSPMTSV